MQPRYLPFKIWHNGQEIEARFITVHMTNDPHALGTMGPGFPIFRQPVQVAPRITDKEANTTEQPMLCILHHNYSGRDWVDDEMVHLRDNSLKAEVHQFCNCKRSWVTRWKRCAYSRITSLTSTSSLPPAPKDSAGLKLWSESRVSRGKQSNSSPLGPLSMDVQPERGAMSWFMFHARMSGLPHTSW